MKEKIDGSNGTSAAAEEIVSEESEKGSVNTLDKYLAQKDAEPGVSQQADSEEKAEAERVAEETEAERVAALTDEERAAALTDEERAAEETESERVAEEAEAERVAALTDEERAAEEAEAELADDENEHEGLDLNDDQRKGVGEIIDRKVGKQVAKRKVAEEALETAEDRVAELEEQLETAGTRQEAGSTSGADLIMQAESEAEVDRFEVDTRAMLKQVKRWLRRHEDGDTLSVPQADGDDIEFSYDQIEDRQDELDDVLAETIPKARKQVEKRKQSVVKAKKTYPKLFDRKSDEYQAMQKVLRQAPSLKLVPDYQLMIGRMLAGEAMEGAKPKKVTSRPPKPSAAKPPETSASNKTKTTSARPTITPGAKTMAEYMGVN